MEACRLGHRLDAVDRFRHDLDVGFASEQHPEPRPHHRLVVNHQHPDGHGPYLSSGNPKVPHPASHAFGEVLDSDVGHALLNGNPVWPILVVLMMVLNTVLGEELLFRGLLLPRMQGAFGRADWFVNGVLFATYHLHQPWSITSAFWDTFILSYPSRRYRSAVLGILVQSMQTLVLLVGVVAVVAG